MIFNEFDLKILKHIDILRNKLNQIPNNSMGCIEFYPTEECNLDCVYCTFKNRDRTTFPFNQISDSIRKLNPASIIISGGGDPTCYESEGKNIADVVKLISSDFPSIKIALITNGQKTISGDWIKNLEWLRVSIDAGNQQTFNKLKRGNLQLSLNSIVTYLKNGCKYLGVGYVFNDNNVTEIPEFTQLIYKTIISNLGQNYLEKVYLEFRPTCKIDSCNCQSLRYKDDEIRTSDKSQYWFDVLSNVHKEIFGNDNVDYIRFVKEKSNLDETKVLCYANKKINFKMCYYCLLKMIIYPTGYCYPCVQISATRKKSLGNIMSDPIDEILENQQRCSRGEYICNGDSFCCNVISQKNAILEYYLSKSKIPTVDHIRWSDFF